MPKMIPNSTHAKNDMENIEQLMEPDDIIYIIADGKKSKIDVNVEKPPIGSGRALDGDASTDNVTTAWSKIGQLKRLPDCNQLFGEIKFNEKESCGCEVPKPKISEMTLKADLSIQALLSAALPSKGRKNGSTAGDLGCHCSENCGLHSVSGKSNQCFASLIKKLTQTASSAKNGPKATKKSHGKQRRNRQCNICGLRKAKDAVTEKLPKKSTENRKSEDPTLVSKWKQYLSEVMRKLVEELPKGKEPPCTKGPACMPVKKRKLSLYSRNKLFEAQKQSGKPAVLKCSCGRTREVIDAHKQCAGDSKKVPAHMGWNWNTTQMRPGWRPGAVPKSVKKQMRHFLRPCPCDTLPVTKRAVKGQQPLQTLEPNECEQIPTLRVQRRNNEYTITMNPLKNAQTLKSEPYPYLNCKPLQFKISSSAEERELQKISEFICAKGFKKCVCGHKIIKCRCRDNREMEALHKCLIECSQKFNVRNLEEKLCLADSTKLDIEFTPPAGVIKNALKRRPDQLAQETQYDELDYRCTFDGNDGGKGGKKGKGSKSIEDGVGKAGGNANGGKGGAGGTGAAGSGEADVKGGGGGGGGGGAGKDGDDENKKDAKKSKEKKKDGKSGSKEGKTGKAGQSSKEDNKKSGKGKGKSK